MVAFWMVITSGWSTDIFCPFYHTSFEPIARFFFVSLEPFTFVIFWQVMVGTKMVPAEFAGVGHRHVRFSAIRACDHVMLISIFLELLDLKLSGTRN
jgi:hypothetical protein